MAWVCSHDWCWWYWPPNSAMLRCDLPDEDATRFPCQQRSEYNLKSVAKEQRDEDLLEPIKLMYDTGNLAIPIVHVLVR